MAFNDAEISTQDGRPVALYLLVWGETTWRYTSADRDIEYPAGSGNVYLARAVSDSGMVQGGSAQNDFTMNCPANLPIVDLFRGTPPSETIDFTVRRMNYGEADAPIYWIGTVTNVKRLGLVDAQVIGKPLTASFKRTGLRLCWTRECPHFLYDPGCKVDPEDFRVDATILSITGNTVTVDTVGGNPVNWFSGGFTSWEINDDGTIERRMIERQDGTLLTIFGLTDGMEVGTVLALYPGCDRSPTTCRDKFDNLANNGGFSFMPGQTPFGTLIF
jgi:uncharacterized phage protein (TIGR02218 family)